VGAPDAVDQAVVAYALGQGWLRREELREALLLQDQLAVAGRATTLLPLLAARFLSPDHVEGLREVYKRACPKAPSLQMDAGGGEITLPPPIVVPPECLARSWEALHRMPEEDPDVVREFLAACELDSCDVPENPSSAESESCSPSLAGEALRVARARMAQAYREVRRLDPHCAPHADEVLEQLGLLGEGGMGVVYRVRDARLGREAALKLVKSDQAEDDVLLRFRREVEITARLDHPSIPPVYEAGTTSEGRHYMLMRVVEGHPLSLAIQESHERGHSASGERGGQRTLLEALVKVGEAVAYAHSRRIVHRDLKPQNVMLGRFGEVFVVDWGLARDFSQGVGDHVSLRRMPNVSFTDGPGGAELTEVGAVMGTPGYMAPEQAAGGAVDARTDVFALGAILCCVLTGRPPIEGATPMNKVYATLHGKIALPRERCGNVAAELNSIAARALAREARERYSTAERFVADLRAYLAGEKVSAHRYQLRELLLRSARQHAALLVGVGVGLTALFGVGSALAFAAQQRALAAQQKARAKAEEQARTEAERSARDIEDEQTRSLAYADGGRLRILRERERALTCLPRDEEALRRWLEEARGLIEPERLARHGIRRDALAVLGNERDLTTAEQAERDAIEALLRGLEELRLIPATGAIPHPQTIAGVEARLRLAQELRQLSVDGDGARRAWDEACRAISNSPRYAGLQLKPIVGLVPIGPDPYSGLWELWHIASGDCPERGPDGHLRLSEGSGIVLVLIPPGRFTMGSTADHSEQPLHEVRLEAFLLSKDEMTQGQWLRAAGENPSNYKAGDGPFTLLNPVEQVSWEDVSSVLKRLGLQLPSEAQWEYACRAGTDSTWWTGSQRQSLQGSANLADTAYQRAGGTNPTEAWDDGYPVHAPVGRFRANPFGLRDMVGNVWEWVEDTYESSYRGAPEDGSPWVVAGASSRVVRGGGWVNDASNGRSANRDGNRLANRSHALGFRAALTIDQ